MIGSAARQAEAEFSAPARITIEETNSYPGLHTPEDAQVASWARALTGKPATKAAFGTEAGFFAELGLPAIVLGPGDMSQDGHKPDEGLELTALAASDAMLGRVLEEITGPYT